MVAAADSEDDTPSGQYVGGGEVLGKPQRVPHGGDVETAAELDSLGQVGQVDGEHQDVGDALVSLTLEVVLGQPHGVEPGAVQDPGDVGGLVEDGGESLVR